MADPQTPSDVTIFAKTNFRNSLKPFGIKIDDRRRHMYVIGKTGMGKSTLLENMIIQDIRAGRGLALVDPHGDTVEKVIKFVPSHRINDIVYFNPADVEYPIAFNILEAINPSHRHLVASGLISVFKKVWADSWGPRLEYILRNTILALIEYPGSTLLGVNRMFIDKEYRDKVIRHISDPVVKSFWTGEFAAFSNQFRTEAVSPIQNKIGQFLSSAIIRNIVGQPKSTIDMRELMDNSKIVLMNLAKGRIGEDNAGLLGAMMITKLQLAAMSRIDIAESERRDFYLYVDEFQNFATESFANILSEARKYRLDLIIAHQYIEQLDEKVRAAVFGNVGTIITFRVGAADAEFLAKEYMPVFTETDLVNLTKYDMYLKLMIDGVASEPFSATGMPPVGNPDNLEDTVIRVSRERYAKERKVVEEKISRWTGADEQGGNFESEGGIRKREGRREERDNRSAGGGRRSEEPAGLPKDAVILERQPIVVAAEPQAIALSAALQPQPDRGFSRARRPEWSSSEASPPSDIHPPRDRGGQPARLEQRAADSQAGSRDRARRRRRPDRDRQPVAPQSSTQPVQVVRDQPTVRPSADAPALSLSSLAPRAPSVTPPPSTPPAPAARPSSPTPPAKPSNPSLPPVAAPPSRLAPMPASQSAGPKPLKPGEVVHLP